MISIGESIRVTAKIKIIKEFPFFRFFEKEQRWEHRKYISESLAKEPKCH